GALVAPQLSQFLAGRHVPDVDRSALGPQRQQSAVRRQRYDVTVDRAAVRRVHGSDGPGSRGDPPGAVLNTPEKRGAAVLAGRHLVKEPAMVAAKGNERPAVARKGQVAQARAEARAAAGQVDLAQALPRGRIPPQDAALRPRRGQPFPVGGEGDDPGARSAVGRETRARVSDASRAKLRYLVHWV